ncbi:Transmembrane 9 superfamily member 3 [Sarcoptes scabiei]|nr:Transmembrane 9 superfamily member 3 [Sarcoptes scabiei]
MDFIIEQNIQNLIMPSSSGTPIKVLDRILQSETLFQYGKELLETLPKIGTQSHCLIFDGSAKMKIRKVSNLFRSKSNLFLPFSLLSDADNVIETRRNEKKEQI